LIPINKTVDNIKLIWYSFYKDRGAVLLKVAKHKKLCQERFVKGAAAEDGLRQKTDLVKRNKICFTVAFINAEGYQNKNNYVRILPARFLS